MEVPFPEPRRSLFGSLFGRFRSSGSAERPRRRVLSPLTRRILIINVLTLAIPVAGLLYLGPYRDGLVVAELDGLKTQADVFAGALGEGAIETHPSGFQALNVRHARNMIRRLTAPTRIRARLFLIDGSLVADSRSLGGRGQRVQVFELPPPRDGLDVVEQMMVVLDQFIDTLHGPEELELYRERATQTAEDYPEAKQALSGEVTGVARRDGRGGYVLSVAMPVQRYHHVIGVIMLSKGGGDIEAAIRQVRFVILQIFAGALVVTVLLSLYLAGTIARPVRRLALAAVRVRRGVGGEVREIPDLTHRGDEIGDLSGALREMTAALYQRMTAVERFAADVAHEIKNPLTSLRSAVETAARISEPEQQTKLMAIIKEDVVRLDRLISDISDYSRLDAEMSREELETVDLERMLQTLSDIYRTTGSNPRAPRIVVEVEGEGPMRVQGKEGRLVQVFRNLLANAQSFSPPGGRITIHLSKAGKTVQVLVEDEGPGMPENKLDAIFDRFYSERPAGEKFGTHSGLGLSISKQIVLAHAGTIRAENRTDSTGRVVGARFVVRLPSV